MGQLDNFGDHSFHNTRRVGHGVGIVRRTPGRIRHCGTHHREGFEKHQGRNKMER